MIYGRDLNELDYVYFARIVVRQTTFRERFLSIAALIIIRGALQAMWLSDAACVQLTFSGCGRFVASESRKLLLFVQRAVKRFRDCLIGDLYAAPLA